MAINMGFLTNPMTWIVATFFFALLFVVLLIFVIILAKMTHAITELKAKMKGAPIAMFFMDSRYCDWKVIKPEA